MTELHEAAIEFEKILPYSALKIISTKTDFAYGELHRIYYDVADLSEEDSELVEAVKIFVEMTEMKVGASYYCVENLRSYLCNHSKNANKENPIWKKGDPVSGFYLIRDGANYSEFWFPEYV